MDLFGLFQNVAGAITRHNDPNQPQYPQQGLLGAVEGLFQQHASSTGASWGGSGNVAPASQDPYGDPGAGGAVGNIAPASRDPYGDPG